MTGDGLHQVPVGARYDVSRHGSKLDLGDLHQQGMFNEPCRLLLFQHLHMSDVRACRAWCRVLAGRRSQSKVRQLEVAPWLFARHAASLFSSLKCYTLPLNLQEILFTWIGSCVGPPGRQENRSHDKCHRVFLTSCTSISAGSLPYSIW